MNRRLIVAIALVTAVTGSARAQIIGGAPTRGDRAVVGLASALGTVSCTGTLVSPRVILTAAHCVAAPPTLVFVGDDPDREGVFLPVAAVERHPDYDPATHHADLGLVVLARPAPIAPIALPSRPLTGADVGRPARFVGFGFTEPALQGSLGVKHTATAALDAVTDDELVYGVVGCHGDSGGPALLVEDGVERLIGVTSHGDPDCEVGGASVRVDRFQPWLVARIAALDAPSCALDGRCAAGCVADPDCVGEFPVPAGVGGCAVGGHPTGALPLALVALSLVGRRRRRRRAPIGAWAWALTALAVTAIGCGDADQPPASPYRTFCTHRPIGDLARAAEVAPLVADRAGALAEVEAVAVRRPLADGSLGLTVSARARHLDGCAVALRASLAPLAGEDPPPGPVTAAGTFLELFATDDGWGAPLAATTVGTVELPAVAGADYLLTVIVEDQDGAVAGASLPIAIE